MDLCIRIWDMDILFHTFISNDSCSIPISARLVLPSLYFCAFHLLFPVRTTDQTFVCMVGRSVGRLVSGTGTGSSSSHHYPVPLILSSVPPRSRLVLPFINVLMPYLSPLPRFLHHSSLVDQSPYKPVLLLTLCHIKKTTHCGLAVSCRASSAKAADSVRSCGAVAAASRGRSWNSTALNAALPERLLYLGVFRYSPLSSLLSPAIDFPSNRGKPRWFQIKRTHNSTPVGASQATSHGSATAFRPPAQDLIRSTPEVWPLSCEGEMVVSNGLEQSLVGGCDGNGLVAIRRDQRDSVVPLGCQTPADPPHINTFPNLRRQKSPPVVIVYLRVERADDLAPTLFPLQG